MVGVFGNSQGTAGMLALPAGLTVAATLIVRFFTLWLGVGIGMVALVVLLRQLDIDADAQLELNERPPAPVQPYV